MKAHICTELRIEHMMIVTVKWGIDSKGDDRRRIHGVSAEFLRKQTADIGETFLFLLLDLQQSRQLQRGRLLG